MKTILIITVVLQTLFSGAQTNRVAIFTTNVVTAVPWYREVNGTLYNTQRSQLFQHLPFCTVENVVGGSIAFEYSLIPPTAYNAQLHDAVLINYPLDGMAKDHNFSVTAMKVGTTNLFGTVLELWDYGTPHHVIVITTNYVRLKMPVDGQQISH